jgi:hypothetical protein
MSTAAHQPADRPLLRLFEPTLGEGELYSITKVHQLFRQPELVNRSEGYRRDCMRALAKWEEFELVLKEHAQRIAYPLPIKDITSSLMRAFQEWLFASTSLSPSSVNKMVREILTTIAMAGDDGLEVKTVRCKRLAEPTGAKIYFDDKQVASLWNAAAAMQWPSESKSRGFSGTGISPGDFWRCAIVLLRSYGMRVQDLVAYETGKTPVTWREVCFDAKTPNPNGREEWALGWFTYRSSKVGRQYYLPMTKYTRAAIDRLYAGAQKRATAAGLDAVPGDWAVMPSPRGGALPRYWKALCLAAEVVKPIKPIGVEQVGEKWLAKTTVNERRFDTQEEAQQWLEVANQYVMEDFRSTAATFYAAIEESLPNKVCGWADGSRVNVGRKNYINDEPVLLKYLPTAPMPPCFDDWTNS